MPQNALLRNRHHIRSIDIGCQEELCLTALTDDLPCPLPVSGTSNWTCSLSSSSISEQQHQDPLRLRSITIHQLPESNDAAAQHLLSLTFHCYYLTVLNIPSLVLTRDPFYHELLLHTISSKLPNLEQLAFLGVDQVALGRTASLFEVSFQHPKLTALKCWFSAIFTSPWEDSISMLLQSIGIPSDHGGVSHETMDHTNPPRIKDLRLPLFPVGFPVHRFLKPLLIYHGLGLERLGIPFNFNADNHSYSQFFAQYCPKLRHTSFNFQDQYKLCLHRALDDLLSFSVRGGTTRIFHLWMLMVADHFPAFQSETLREINIMECKADGSFMSAIIVIPSLERLWVSLPGPGSDVPLAQVLPTGDWKCLDLKELCYCYDSEGDGMERYLFHMRIGRLIHLEVLGIGRCEKRDSQGQLVQQRSFGRPVDSPPLMLAMQMMCSEKFRHLMVGHPAPLSTSQEPVGTLPRGWLSELANLKKLRHFFLMTDLWSKMTQADVQFMDGNWPQLERITFGFRKAQLADIVCQPHWQWLKEKRPWIQYSYWSDNSRYIAINL